MFAWSAVSPYHHQHQFDNYSSSFYRPFNTLATIPDQLLHLNGIDSIFEFPSHWLDEIRVQEQQQQQRSNRAAEPQRQQSEQTTEIVSDGETFKVNLDVTGFKPEELSVTCVRDRFLVVQGKHQELEEKDGVKGYVTREFKRSYLLPKGVDVKKVKSNLSTDGRLLSLEAPKVEKQAIVTNERVIPIEHQLQQSTKEENG